MKVWVVCMGDVEGSSIRCICATKEIAERELFKCRDELIEKWKRSREFQKEETRKYMKDLSDQGIGLGFDMGRENSYEAMIKKLSNDDYEKWENYPLECPYLYVTEVKEQ